MTAKSPAIMVPAAAQPRWRITWAERENHRRQRAYDSEADAWRRRHDQLIRLQVEAGGFLGCTQPRTGLPVELDDDEVVYRLLPDAELVEAEARHLPGLPAPGLTVAADGVGAPDRALPRGLRVVDAGMAVVTNHRVAFAGRTSRREWTYAEMMGPAHHPEVPFTLLHTTDGGRLAGLLGPAAATVNFRFYLTLAFATATGRRAAIAAQVDTLLDAHQGARPMAPPPVEPDDAPPTALRPGRLAATVVALVFTTLAAGTFESERAGLPYRADSGAAGITATTGAPDANGTSGPPAPPGSGTAASLPGPAATRPAGGAPGADGPVPPPGTTSRGAVAASAVAATGPAAHPAPTTRGAPTTGPAPTTTRPSTTGPAPSTAPPSPEPAVVNVCAKPSGPPREQPRCPPADP